MKDLIFLDDEWQQPICEPNELHSAVKEWIEAIDNHRWDKSDKYLEEHPKLKKAIEGDYYHCQVIEEWIKYFFNLEDDE